VAGTPRGADDHWTTIYRWDWFRRAPWLPTFRERADEHRLHVVHDASGLRLETSTIRQPSMWDWPALERLFSHAGYADLRTETVSIGGRTVDVNVAVR